MSQQSFSLVEDELAVLTKFIENQIILMEPSPVKQKLDELRKKGQKFVDVRFPANNASLCGEWADVKGWKWI